MRLATAAQVLERMNVSSTSTKEALVNSALEASTTIIENILGTPLSAANRVDYYNPHVSPFDKSVIFEYNLEQGLVDGAPSVYYSVSGVPITDISGLTLLDTSYVATDGDNGVVTVNKAPITGTYMVAISYAAGLSEDAEGQAQNVPNWLKEIAISAAVYVVHTQGATHNKKDILDRSPELIRFLRMQLNSHIRPRGMGFYPAKSTVVV